jgi:hypothetical protein
LPAEHRQIGFVFSNSFLSDLELRAPDFPPKAGRLALFFQIGFHSSNQLLPKPNSPIRQFTNPLPILSSAFNYS